MTSTTSERPAPLVVIVILNWNGLQDTLQCIERLRSLTHTHHRLLVIDNGSSDGSAARLAQLPGIHFVSLPHNTGYTGGNNAAIVLAMQQGADYIWLLNNDTLVEPDALRRMVELAESDARIGLVSPLLYHLEQADAVQHCCTRFDLQTLAFDETCDPEQGLRWQRETPAQIALWGTALLIRRAVVERIGVLDERLFAYREDLEYSLRSARAGFHNVVCTAATVHHHWPSGVRRSYYYYFMVRNEILVWPRYLGRAQALRKLRWNLYRTRRPIATLQGHDAAIEAALLGLWHGWLGRGGPWDASLRMPRWLRICVMWRLPV